MARASDRVDRLVELHANGPVNIAELVFVLFELFLEPQDTVSKVLGVLRVVPVVACGETDHDVLGDSLEVAACVSLLQKQCFAGFAPWAGEETYDEE
jgi:hypothetical protein